LLLFNIEYNFLLLVKLTTVKLYIRKATVVLLLVKNVNCILSERCKHLPPSGAEGGGKFGAWFLRRRFPPSGFFNNLKALVQRALVHLDTSKAFISSYASGRPG
jgi:hypothetical protein